MAIDVLKTLDIIEAMENYIAERRPPEEMRHKLDLGYKLEGQDIIVFEIRPVWNKPNEKMESPFAKTTFVKSKNHWKVFWMRSDLKWHAYQPVPNVPGIKDFIRVIEEDTYHCFWG